MGAGKSEPLKVQGGAPHGSITRSLLFIVYMKDFFNMFNLASCKAYAIYLRDLRMLSARSLDNWKEYQDNIAYHLDCISRWVAANEREMNWTKTFAIVSRFPNVHINLAFKISSIRYVLSLRRYDHISAYVLLLILYNINLRQASKKVFNLFSFSRLVRNNVELRDLWATSFR